MSKNYTAVVDFGSEKITVAVGTLGKNGLSILGSAEAKYGGYLNGEFLQIDKLGESIKNAITLAENNSNIKITDITVGVPSAFAVVFCKDVVQNYNKKIRVSSKTINNLYELGDDFAKFSTYTVISSDAVEFVLDDGVSRNDCIGFTTSKIKANVSYILVENKFINLITEITKILGYNIVSFISEMSAQYKYLLENELEPSVIVDCGHLSTSIAVCKGNGLLALSEFSLGGGFITSDIMRWLKLDYDTSELLKRKVVLSIVPEEQDVYEIKSKSEVLSLPAYSANGVVSNKVEQISKNVAKVMEKHKQYINDDTTIYLCGGGITYIKGAKEIFSKIIGHNVQVLTPSIPQLARAHYTSVLSLLYIACEKYNSSRKFLIF